MPKSHSKEQERILTMSEVVEEEIGDFNLILPDPSRNSAGNKKTI
jgi:hypothetical protein